MVMTDPIADMLTIIRNGLMMKKSTVKCPFSRIKEHILTVLQEEGFIDTFKVAGEEAKEKMIRIYLKYGPKGEFVINEIERISKPGKRIYSSIKDLKKVQNGLGIKILSTPKGVVSDRIARRENVGGEVICSVW